MSVPGGRQSSTVTASRSFSVPGSYGKCSFSGGSMWLDGALSRLTKRSLAGRTAIGFREERRQARYWRSRKLPSQALSRKGTSLRHGGERRSRYTGRVRPGSRPGKVNLPCSEDYIGYRRLTNEYRHATSRWRVLY